ncbi:hypothetical protein ACWD01_36725 [Streptomyces sp. NPDC002835]
MTEWHNVQNSEHDVNARLAVFVPAKLRETQGMIGTPQRICAGVESLVEAYIKIMPHVRDAGPDYAPGVVDGLRHALAYVAVRFEDHPDFEERFNAQAPGTLSEWPE